MGEIEVSRAIADVIVERQRQINPQPIGEGYSPRDDDRYDFHELADAAAYVAMQAGSLPPPPELWPWKRHLSDHPRRRKLVIAAALLIAEIERVDREAERVEKRLDANLAAAARAAGLKAPRDD